MPELLPNLPTVCQLACRISPIPGQFACLYGSHEVTGGTSRAMACCLTCDSQCVKQTSVWTGKRTGIQMAAPSTPTGIQMAPSTPTGIQMASDPDGHGCSAFLRLSSRLHVLASSAVFRASCSCLASLFTSSIKSSYRNSLSLLLIVRYLVSGRRRQFFFL
jgi:hypothetical protein